MKPCAFFSLLFFFLNSYCALANNDTIAARRPKNEVCLSEGWGSSDRLLDGVEPLSGPPPYYVQNYSGTFSLSYHRKFDKYYWIGLAMSYEKEGGDWSKQDTGSAYATIGLGTFKRQCLTVALEFVYAYYHDRFDYCTFYGSIGTGMTMQNEIGTYDYTYYENNFNNGVNSLGPSREVDNSRTHFNLYYSPIGLSVGKTLRWFGEIGFGYKGLFNSGLSYKF